MVGSFSAGLLFVPAITQDFLRYRPKVGTVIANLGTRQEKVSILRWRQWDTNRSCPGNPLYSTSRTEMKKNRAAKTSSSYFAARFFFISVRDVLYKGFPGHEIKKN